MFIWLLLLGAYTFHPEAGTMNSAESNPIRPATTLARPASPASQPAVVWALLPVGTLGSSPPTILHPFPFSVGRKSGCSLQLASKAVSSQHAHFDLQGDQLVLTDKQSTNGTYVNGQRVTEPVVVGEDDLVQFADVAFRVRVELQATNARTVSEDVCDRALALVQFDRMMENRLVTPYFQPIVAMNNGDTIGYEILARSRLFGLETSAAMFEAASKLNMEVELSHMLRWEGVREGLTLPVPVCLYVNTHPLELQDADLVESMRQVRELSPELPLVLEIHEAAVTNPKDIADLSRRIRELNISIAYDDFGAGQGRIAELCECPPDILKFDMSLIRNIENASPERQRMLASLVVMVKELGVQTLAEGIETEGEAEVCRQMQFDSAQGYFFGRPAPPRKYFEAAGVNYR